MLHPSPSTTNLLSPAWAESRGRRAAMLDRPDRALDAIFSSTLINITDCVRRGGKATFVDSTPVHLFLLYWRCSTAGSRAMARGRIANRLYSAVQSAKSATRQQKHGEGGILFYNLEQFRLASWEIRVRYEYPPLSLPMPGFLENSKEIDPLSLRLDAVRHTCSSTTLCSFEATGRRQIYVMRQISNPTANDTFAAILP
jgi:hypothetical protein